MRLNSKGTSLRRKTSLLLLSQSLTKRKLIRQKKKIHLKSYQMRLVMKNYLWKNRHNKGKGPKKSSGRYESSSGQKKSSGKEVTCFECKESGHYKSDCPKLKKDKRPRKVFKKKALITFDATDSDEAESEEDEAVEALMATTSRGAEASEDDSDSDNDDEVFSNFSISELRTALSEIMKKHDVLLNKHKELKRKYAVKTSSSEVHEKSVSELMEENYTLVNDNVVLRAKNDVLEDQLASSDVKYETKYEKAFQKFLAKGIDRSLMASMIYGMSRNGNSGLGYFQSMKDESSEPKREPLHKHFVPAGTVVPEKVKPKVVKPNGKFKLDMSRYYIQVPVH
uniref:CCHC-type domain-containing protein n=1 Tax=Solanum lycopersicum TaxID=4081 RepID=A0A494G955_SOLLC